MPNEIKIINIDDILPNRFQPRIQFNDDKINELADSIKEHGVIQPIVVRKVSDKFEIIAGERRYKASILAGKTTIPAIVTDLNDKDSAEIALIENVQRQDLTPIEEAISYKKILDMGYLTQSDLAEKLGKTQSTIANKLRLLNLDDEVQEALLDSKISERHARSLLKLDKQNQVILLNRIINERLTVRKTDEEIDKMQKQGFIKLNEIEGDKNNMDEKIINEFNIPTSPIMDAQEVSEKEMPAFQNDTESSKEVNPGFMDIDKIEETASNLFETKADANIDMLMEKPEIKEETPVVESPMQPILQPEEQKPSGRFFNMFGMNQEENPNHVDDFEKTEANMDFGIPSYNQTFNSVVEPVNPVQPEVKEEVVSAPDQTVNSNIFSGFNDNLSEMPIEIKPEVEQSILENNVDSLKEEVNSMDDFTFNPVNSFSLTDEETFSTPTPNSNIEIPNTNQEIPFGPFQNLNNEFNSQPVVEETPVVEEIPSVQESTSESLFNGSIPTSPIIEEPVSSFVNSNPTIPSMQSQSSFVEPIYDDEEIEVKPIEPENITVADFRTVLNTIRECGKTIEKYGYKIDLEEIDLEDSYQVIFNIDKK